MSDSRRGYGTPQEAISAAGRSGLTLRVIVELKESAAGVYLSDDEAEDDENEVVIARRDRRGWRAWPSRGGRGSREHNLRLGLAIGVGSGGGTSRTNGSAEIHSEVSGRVISPAVAKVEITFGDDSRQSAKIANRGYLWFHAESGHPLRGWFGKDLPEIPDRLQAVLVAAYDAEGTELQRQEMGLHRHLAKPPRWPPFGRGKASASLRLYKHRDRDRSGE
ncbi:MAG: hypothetical protein M3T56_19915 [Chloroflexota bacterium]|nr:hypothetical protein [Chloroflexota bacterium]